jgi:hypothetical protein
MLRLSLAFALFATAAQAQLAGPSPELDCEATEGGLSCTVEATESLLYCIALDAAGDPVANSTVSAGTGVAVFNTEAADRIADVQCRVE